MQCSGVTFFSSFFFLVILNMHNNWQVLGFAWIVGMIGLILDYDKTYFDNFNNIFLMEGKLEKVSWYIYKVLNIEENL